MPIDGKQIEIKPAEIIGWSWANTWRSLSKARRLALGFGGGLAFGLPVGFASQFFQNLNQATFHVKYTGIPDWRFFGLVNGFLIGFSIFLLSGLLGGLSSEVLDRHLRLKPNEGIWRSARNSLLIGLVITLTTGLFFGLSNLLVANLLWPNIQPYGVVYPGLVFGLVFGIISALLSGGTTCIEHIVLRLFLWSANLTPWNYPHFLDYANERVLLYKIGGGYIFLHQVLQEYFATLNEALHSLQGGEKQKVNQPKFEKRRMERQAQNVQDILSVPVLKKIAARNQWKKRVFKGSPFVINGTLFFIIVFATLWRVPIFPLHTYPPSLHANLVLDDSMMNSNQHWVQQIAPNGDTCRLTREGYQVVSLVALGMICPNISQNFSDFTFEAQMQIIKGDTGGIVFRNNKRAGAFYFFLINKEGRFDLIAVKGSGATGTRTLVKGISLAFHRGYSQGNLIAIVAQGNTFELYINHLFAVAATDKDNISRDGSLALLAVAPNKPPEEVLYYNVRIWIPNL